MSRRAGVACALALMVLAAGCGRESGFSEADIALNNRGVALMGYFDYPGAQATFAELVEKRPDWLDARLNLAIATLNRQGEEDVQRALDIVAGVLADDPDHLRGHYVAGLLQLYLGDAEASLVHFRTVAEADPGDAYAAYYVAQNLLQKEQLEATLEWYDRAMSLDPYLRSAYYGAALVHRRLGDLDRATELLDIYQRFKDNPRARLAEFKYTRMGPRGEAVAVGRETGELAAVPAGPLFGPPMRVTSTADVGPTPALTAVELTGDGVTDIFVAGGAGGGGALFAGAADGSAVRVDHPLASIRDVVANAWGDVDNDGLTDAYLCRAGANQLWRQSSPGTWEDITAATGTGDAGRCADAAMFDADHDGDLDIFVVNADGPDELFNNNLDGTFRRLAATQGLQGPGPGRQLVVSDIDRDRDADILVVNEGAPHSLFLNDRLWAYRAAPDFGGFLDAPADAVAAVDRDADGRPEIYTAESDGSLAVWTSAGGDEWSRRAVADVAGEGRGFLAVADFDGDGFADVLAGRGEGAVVLAGEPASSTVRFELSGLASPPLPVVKDVAKGPGLAAVVRSPEAALGLWPPGEGRHPFLALTLTGKEEPAESMRSNRSGIGARTGLRLLDRWSMDEGFDAHSGPGQSLQPLARGTAGRAAADYVAITWSDGVFQTELDLAAGELHRVAETQRQLSSCPVLFAWDGERYRFVSDLLGVGGLGFFVAPGTYATPRPRERFIFPEGVLVPRDDRYRLKITEPMEENAYLDQVRLDVYDLPPGWSMTMDERMGTGGARPTGEPVYYRRATPPSRVVDDGGRDVTAAVSEVDQRAAPIPPVDARFVGRLSRPHALVLEFDDVINPEGTRPVLVADGWVEYPYSQTVFAAWQAGASYDPPSLEARTADGAWRSVYPNFGYPAGMPREMALPLDDLPAGTTALRLTGNLEIYWDRLRVVYAETPPEVRIRRLDPVTARLAKTGFPRRSNGPQRLPGYDYEVRRAFWDTKYLAGFYTALGPVDPLLAAADDAVVIVGPGEEVHLEFDAVTPPPAGWGRRVVLDARGYAKDMDLYTRDGETVGPLPVTLPLTDAERSRREHLHARFNTRFQAGR